MKKLNIDPDFHPVIEKAALSIAPLFRLYGWEWASVGIPTVSDIETEITNLAQVVIDGKEWASSGRVTVRRVYDGPTMSIEVSLRLGEIYED